MNSKYQIWLAKQPLEFRSIIHRSITPVSYINEDYAGVSLEELEALDNKYIFNQSPEGGEKK